MRSRKHAIPPASIATARGTFTFSGIYGQHGPTGSGGSGTGADANLDFLTGSMSGFAQSLFQQNALRGPIPSLYIQDTYHVTKKIVISGGVRWQPEYWPYDVFNRGSGNFPRAVSGGKLRTTGSV